jgi:hypothetical protein
MGWYGIITVLHVVSAAIGVGAAAASDSVFMGAIRNRRISNDQFVLIRKSSDVLIGGLVILILTGVALLHLNVELWSMPHFQAKMTVVLILLINGIAFHARVIPMLKEYSDITMPQQFITSRQWLLAITGSTSAVSWFSALIIAVVGDIGAPYLLYIAIIAVLIVGGSVVAHYLLTHIIFVQESNRPEELKEDKEALRKKRIIMVLITLFVILVVSLIAAVVRYS